MSKIDDFNTLWSVDILAEVEQACADIMCHIEDNSLYKAIIQELSCIYNSKSSAKDQLQSLLLHETGMHNNIMYGSPVPAFAKARLAVFLHYYCTDDQDLNLVRRTATIVTPLSGESTQKTITNYGLVPSLWSSDNEFASLEEAFQGIWWGSNTKYYDVLCLNTAEPLILDLLRGLQDPTGLGSKDESYYDSTDTYKKMYDSLLQAKGTRRVRKQG